MTEPQHAPRERAVPAEPVFAMEKQTHQRTGGGAGKKSNPSSEKVSREVHEAGCASMRNCAAKRIGGQTRSRWQGPRKISGRVHLPFVGGAVLQTPALGKM